MLGFNVLAGAALAEKPISSSQPAPSATQVDGGDAWPREYVEDWIKRLRALERQVEGKRQLDREEADEILGLVNTVVYGVSADVVEIQAEVSQLMADKPAPEDTSGFGFGDITITGVMSQLREYEARMREQVEQEEEEDLEFLLLH